MASNRTKLASFSCLMIRILTVIGCVAGPPLCVEEERVALLAIKSDINSSNAWLHSWMGFKCCQWIGVTCNNITGHVTSLNLQFPYNRNLDYRNLGPSKVNPSLSKLTQLTSLDLSMNNFNGAPFPDSITSLHNLQYLDLSHASFNGTLPQELGKLNKLRYLDLRSMSLYGEDNSYYLVANDLHWLSQTPHLKYLDMSGVHIKYLNWASTINMLPSLSVLILQSTKCDNIPATLPRLNLSSLKVLDLSSNNFNSAIPRWIFNITSLIDLRLSSSGLHGAIPYTLGSLVNLQHLDLSINNFSGMIPQSLGKLRRLEYLKLSGNHIEWEIPEDIRDISGLQFLNLSNNHLSGKFP